MLKVTLTVTVRQPSAAPSCQGHFVQSSIRTLISSYYKRSVRSEKKYRSHALFALTVRQNSGYLLI